MKPNDPKLLLDDAERLFRSVRAKDCKPHENGVRPTKNAFWNGEFYTSVDRAKINGDDPYRTQMSPTDGVAQFLAEDTKESPLHGVDQRTGISITPAEGIVYVARAYADPVEADPVTGKGANPAHAEVRLDPAYTDPKTAKRLYDRLCDHLVRVSLRHGWAIAPEQ